MKQLTIDISRYTREAIEERATIPAPKFEKEHIDIFRKQFHATFMKTWDTTYGGKMTDRRFYSAFSHLKTSDDIKALRDLYIWCRAHKKPFAPIVWKKYAMKQNTQLSTVNSNHTLI